MGGQEGWVQTRRTNQKYGFGNFRHSMTAGAANWLCVAPLVPALSEADTTPAIDGINLVDS